MKTNYSFLLALLLCIPAILLSQNTPPKLKFNEKEYVPVYLGVGTGLYTYSGLLGMEMELPLAPRVSLFGAAGLGGWGFKAGAGVQFYITRAQFGSAFGVGFCNAFGSTGVETELELQGGTGPQAVVLNTYNAPTLNLTYHYNFHLGKKSKFVLGTGYAIALVDKPYDVVSPQNAMLTPESETVMQIVQPGGLMISLKFLFGVGS